MSGYPSRDVMDAEVRKVIAMARELAGLKAGELAAHTGSDRADVLGAYAAALGEAKTLLRALADIAERLAANEEARRESDAEAWGGRGPSASYAEWLAEGRDEVPGRGAAETGP